MLFTVFKIINKFWDIAGQKSETTAGSSWDAKTKTANNFKSLKIIFWPKDLNFSEKVLFIISKTLNVAILEMSKNKKILHLIFFKFKNRLSVET